MIRKLGVRPDQVVDYKAIVGDKSDNIPGVPGVGEKTAVSLLEKFGTLDGIYQNIDQVENRWKGKLEAGKEAAYLSYDLARIRTDLQIKLDLERARSHDFDADRIEAFFQELEFRTLIKTLDKLTGKETSSDTGGSTPRAWRRFGQLSLFASEQKAVFVVQPKSSITVKVVDTSEKLDELAKLWRRRRSFRSTPRPPPPRKCRPTSSASRSPSRKARGITSPLVISPETICRLKRSYPLYEIR